MASASGEFPSGNDGSALEVEDDFFSEEGIVSGPKGHETNGGSDLGSNSFTATLSRKNGHRSSCVAALSSARQRSDIETRVDKGSS